MNNDTKAIDNSVTWTQISQTVYLETKTVSVAACSHREGDDAPTQSKQNYNLDVHKHTEWAFNISDYTRNPHKHLLHQTA